MVSQIDLPSSISAGTGAAFELTFSTAATEPSDVSVCIENETISDSAGSAFLTDAGCGTVTLDVERIDLSFVVPDESIDQGSGGDIEVHMSTPHDVYGFELHITDVPESLDFNDSTVQYGDAIANLDGTNSATVTVSISTDNGSTYHAIASTVAVPADATLVVTDKNSALYLDETDLLRIVGSATGDLTYTVSGEKITDA